jgi:diguanylate cyclase (GGDEF)-like protein
VLYQYRLDPEESWSAWMTEPVTEFTNLSEGKYTFMVRTKDLRAGISPIASWSFSVLPPWYRSHLAWALWALLLLLALLWIPAIRHRALRLRATMLETLVAEQTRELTTAVEQLRLARDELQQKNAQLESVRDELQAKNRQLELANSALETLSFGDPLTGIPNRRQLDETLKAEWNRARRSGAEISLILLDLDHFKSLNDARGHQQGDECLKKIGHFLEQSLRRSGDLAARWGGEEFAVVLPNTDVRGAENFAEQLRVGIEQLGMQHDAHPLKIVTASFGVASTEPGTAFTPDDLIAAADRALYRAKAEGRNCVRSE